MPVTDNRIIEIEGELMKPYETQFAFHFYDGRTKAWLPKKLVDWHPSPRGDRLYLGTMVLPQWLADEKGIE
jgi:hypothetical protein